MEHLEHHLSLEEEDAHAQPGRPRAWTGYHRRKAKGDPPAAGQNGPLENYRVLSCKKWNCLKQIGMYWQDKESGVLERVRTHQLEGVEWWKGAVPQQKEGAQEEAHSFHLSEGLHLWYPLALHTSSWVEHEGGVGWAQQSSLQDKSVSWGTSLAGGHPEACPPIATERKFTKVNFFHVPGKGNGAA